MIFGKGIEVTDDLEATGPKGTAESSALLVLVIVGERAPLWRPDLERLRDLIDEALA